MSFISFLKIVCTDTKINKLSSLSIGTTFFHLASLRRTGKELIYSAVVEETNKKRRKDKTTKIQVNIYDAALQNGDYETVRKKIPPPANQSHDFCCAHEFTPRPKIALQQP